MDDYISRKVAIEAAKHAWAKGLEPTQYIEQIPAADVRPVVRGRWRWVGQDRWNDCYECSQCGKMNTDNSNFCPKCGADMREEKMDEYGGVTFDEVAKAFKNLSERLYEQRQSGYDELHEKIALLSDKEFANKVVSIVGAEYNIYDRFVMYTRMKNVIDLLAYGVCKEDVDKLLQTHTDDIAIKLISGGF